MEAHFLFGNQGLAYKAHGRVSAVYRELMRAKNRTKQCEDKVGMTCWPAGCARLLMLPSSLSVLGDKADFCHPVRGEGVQKLAGAAAELGGICRYNRDSTWCFGVLVSAYRGFFRVLVSASDPSV